MREPPAPGRWRLQGGKEERQRVGTGPDRAPAPPPHIARRRRPWRRSDREKREDRFRSDAGFTSAPPERQSGPEPGGSPAGLCLGQTRPGNFPVLHGRKGEKAQKARTCVRVDRGEGNLSK